MLILEIKHWKADKRRFSTLAWAYAPLDKLVDFGPLAARVSTSVGRGVLLWHGYCGMATAGWHGTG